MSTTPRKDLLAAAAGTIVALTCEARVWKVKKVRVLGKGSFGAAILVEHINRDATDDTHVVVKEINLQVCSSEQHRHFHEEVKVMRKCVRHPNIVRFLDASLDGPHTAFIVMEYCDGGDLSMLLEHAQRQKRPIAEDRVLSILVQLLVALKFLHCDSCIIHRDLKPGNIFLTSTGMAKLGDFGVSVALSQSADVAKTFCGTPYYLAPEVCREQPYNGKADVWSLGVILYQLVAQGTRPFTGATLLVLLQGITLGRYEPLPTPSAYSAELLELIPSMLSVNPNVRPGVKRLLRMPFLMDAPAHCTLPCLSHPYYKSIFPTTEPKPAGGAASGLDQAALDELEAFASDPRAALSTLEAEFGMKASRDEGAMTARQRREMAQQFGGRPPAAPIEAVAVVAPPAAPAPPASAPAPLAQTYSDESFEYDDDFEDDMDACGPTMAPSGAVCMGEEDFLRHSAARV